MSEITEICKVEGCKAPAESSTGLCHDHEIEARQKEYDEQEQYEESLKEDEYGDDDDEEDE